MFSFKFWKTFICLQIIPIKAQIKLLSEEQEARIFDISYAILKNHYKNIKVYFGYTRDECEGKEGFNCIKQGEPMQMTAELILLCGLLDDSSGYGSE